MVAGIPETAPHDYAAAKSLSMMDLWPPTLQHEER